MRLWPIALFVLPVLFGTVSGVSAAADRRRLLITSARGRLGRWLKLLWPAAIDRIARRAIEQRY